MVVLVVLVWCYYYSHNFFALSFIHLVSIHHSTGSRVMRFDCAKDFFFFI